MTARSTTPSHPSTTTVAEGTLVWPLPGQSSRTSETALPLTITVASDSSAGAKTTPYSPSVQPVPAATTTILLTPFVTPAAPPSPDIIADGSKHASSWLSHRMLVKLIVRVLPPPAPSRL
jgi:hypothetical protein